MRFIFVTLGYHPDLIGGAYRYTTEVAERLVQRGARVQALYPADVSDFASETRNGVELVRIPDENGWFISNFINENRSMKAALRRLLNGDTTDQEPPLICLCHAFFGPALSWIKRESDLARAYIYHGPWSEEFLYARRSNGNSALKKLMNSVIASGLKRVEHKALKSSRAIALMSQSMKSRMLRLHGSSQVDPEVIFGGVNETQFCWREDRAKIRSHYGLESSDFLMLAVRRLDPRMGLDCLLRAVARLKIQNSNVKLWIAGKGEQKEALEKMARELDLEESFRLLGFVPEEELPRLYTAADCVIMPSLDLEGFGLATVEALACGAPVIGSDSGATPELLRPLEGMTSTSLLFESGSDKSLYKTLVPYTSGKQSLPDRKICHRYVVERYTWRGPVEAHERIYERVVRRS